MNIRVLLALLICCCFPIAACANAENIPQCPKGWLSLYFATDRQPAADKSGKQIGYGNDRGFYPGDQGGLSYGLYYVNLPDVEDQVSRLKTRKAVDELAMSAKVWTKDLTKPLSRPDKVKNVGSLAMGPYLMDRSEFVKRVRSGVDRVCLYTHGFDVSFPWAVICAARLQAVIPDRVILYSWPSKGSASLSAYTVDECNAEWSLRHFMDFLDVLKASTGGNTGTINLVGHSMGNRIMYWGLRDQSQPEAGGWKFNRLIMCSPDIDRGTAEGNGNLILQKTGVKVAVLVSEKDWPLVVSRDIHGYTRLGRPASPPLTLSYLRPLLPQFIYERLPITSGGMPASNVPGNIDVPVIGAVVGDLGSGVGAVVGQLGHVPIVGQFLPNKHSVFTNVPPTVRGCAHPRILEGTDYLHFYDFTDLDYKRIGHTLPYPFVAHLLADKPAEASDRWKVLKGYWKPDYKEHSNCTIYQIDKLILLK